jgi:hypothetical protein
MYSTVALVTDDGDAPVIFEFNQKTLDALMAYAERRGSMNGIELLLSREASDGSLRIRAGESFDDSAAEILAAPYVSMYDSLYDMYMSKIGKLIEE